MCRLSVKMLTICYAIVVLKHPMYRLVISFISHQSLVVFKISDSDIVRGNTFEIKFKCIYLMIQKCHIDNSSLYPKISFLFPPYLKRLYFCR